MGPRNVGDGGHTVSSAYVFISSTGQQYGLFLALPLFSCMTLGKLL